MARIRTIKPEFFTSEDIVELPPLARLLYVAMWCEADREGRFAWKPRTFKMRYLVHDECNIESLCDAIVKSGLVVLYGDGLAYIPTFSRHQHVNPRESKSVYPAPVFDGKIDASLTRGDASLTHREEGKERKGKEGEGSNTSEPSPDLPAANDSSGDGKPIDDGPIAPESSEKRQKRRPTPDDEKCARYCYGLVLAVLPSAKEPNWNGWGDDVRLMREVDGRTHRDICELFGWASKHHFWCRNILSPATLRKQWDRLTIDRGQGDRSAPSGKPSAYQVAHIDHSATDRAMAEDMARRGTMPPADGNLDF